MPSALPLVGLLLSIVGAILDFASGAFILQTLSTPVGTGMVASGVQSTAWGWTLLLFAMGALLLITGVLGITPLAMRRMRFFGVIMILYGIVMLVIGSFMSFGIAPMMRGGLVSGLTMLMVGLGMIVNGKMMAAKSHM